ncbi:MAG: hypothetical protein ACKVKT_05420 [Rhodospirillales bacterium]|jgi:hypothetical protein
MTYDQADAVDRHGISGSYTIALILFGAITLTLVGHILFFSAGVGSNAFEALYLNNPNVAPTYAVILDLWQACFGPLEFAVRSLSVACAVITVAALARVCVAWSGDYISGAVMPLGLVLFPQTAFTLALSTPHALLSAVFILGVMYATKRDQLGTNISAVIVGGVCGLLPFLGAAGLVLAVVLLIVGEGRDKGFWVLSASTAVALLVVQGFFYSNPLPDLFALGWGVAQNSIVQDGFLRSFSMLWLALFFSAFALWRSEALRLKMGPSNVRRSIRAGGAFLISLVWWALQSTPLSVDPRVSFNAVLVLGVLASLPMVLWMRFVMPSIQSVWVWILLPVVMYSCFWVVMGPIDLSGFPYDQISARP